MAQNFCRNAREHLSWSFKIIQPFRFVPLFVPKTNKQKKQKPKKQKQKQKKTTFNEFFGFSSEQHFWKLANHFLDKQTCKFSSGNVNLWAILQRLCHQHLMQRYSVFSAVYPCQRVASSALLDIVTNFAFHMHRSCTLFWTASPHEFLSRL